MEKEEKEIKKTTKKTTTTKKAPVKKSASVKKESVKKVSEKKETIKKVVNNEKKKEEVKAVIKETKKTPAKKVTVKTVSSKPVIKKENTETPEIKKEVKVETTVVKEDKKEEKVITNTVPKKKISKELFEIRKKRYIIEAIIIAVVMFIALLLLFNKTFLKESYKTDTINISIPRFSYYVKDKDNTVKFYTLRKSANLKEYYNEYLEGFIFYSCAEGNNTFYYNEETKTLIKDIKIEKKFAIKTVEIIYDGRTPEEVCGLR